MSVVWVFVITQVLPSWSVETVYLSDRLISFTVYVLPQERPVHVYLQLFDLSSFLVLIAFPFCKSSTAVSYTHLDVYKRQTTNLTLL